MILSLNGGLPLPHKAKLALFFIKDCIPVNVQSNCAVTKAEMGLKCGGILPEPCQVNP